MSDIYQCDGNVSVNSSLSDISQEPETIPVIVSCRPDNPSYCSRSIVEQKRNLIRIKRSNKVLEAGNLPIILNLNPRSLFNKSEEFKTLVQQTEASVCFVSESWDRSHVNGGQRLEDIINIEGYKWVQNVAQRRKNGGKPALLINEEMFYIKEVCPDLITVPIGVEACWAVLTPKSYLSKSKMKYIAVASLYYTVATKRSEFLDHISEAYHTLCAKYGSNLKFIISGDFNRLKYKPILNLSADLKQVVTIPTRLNPDAILDLIFTNLHSYYHLPTTTPQQC